MISFKIFPVPLFAEHSRFVFGLSVRYSFPRLPPVPLYVHGTYYTGNVLYEKRARIAGSSFSECGAPLALSFRFLPFFVFQRRRYRRSGVKDMRVRQKRKLRNYHE